jgi:two-component sensor histidine kinase
VRTAVDLPHAGEAISARLGALGRVHDLLLRTSWAGAMLPELLKTAIEPFETPGREQFRIQPTPIRINPAAALPFVMTINELCTNASKHGALTVPYGRMNIATKVSERDGTFISNGAKREGLSLESPRGEASGCFSSKKASRSNSRARRECDSSRAAWSAKLTSPLAAIQQQTSN